MAEHPRRTGVRSQQGGEHADGGGLARAVGAKKAVDHAPGHGEVYSVNRGDVPEPSDKSLCTNCQAIRTPRWIMPAAHLFVTFPRAPFFGRLPRNGAFSSTLLCSVKYSVGTLI